MASQLNPAWQRKPASSSRLANISAEFLSDPPETTKGNDVCRAIPFLLDTPELSWIPHDLCQVLTQRGHNSTLYTLEEVPGDGEQPRLPDILHQESSGCEYCLLPTTSTATILEQKLDHVVMLVPANLEAVLAAYQRIKLLSQYKTPEIGIVLVGPRDQHAAWRYFRKLAVGTLRYLDVPLLNLGFLPEQVTPVHGPADHHRHNFLARISERLLGSEFHSALTAPSVSRERA
jgi:hypothetical protein